MRVADRGRETGQIKIRREKQQKKYRRSEKKALESNERLFHQEFSVFFLRRFFLPTADDTATTMTLEMKMVCSACCVVRVFAAVADIFHVFPTR